jgi:hypothetical protein
VTSADEQREAIRASGLFDPDFYRKIYGGALAGWNDPLEHFLAVGLARGYLPSRRFDPPLYRMLVPECGDANPLLHHLRAGVPFQPPPLKEVFPGITFGAGRQVAERDAEYFDRYRAYAKRAADAREMPFEADGRRYALRVPEPAALLDRLENDRPFAFARLPHGFWDSVWTVSVAEAAISAHDRGRSLTADERHALAGRYCAAARPGRPNFSGSFMDEVLAAIPLNAGHPDFLRAVSFVGKPNCDEDVWGERTALPRDAVLGLFARHYQPEEPIYDALLWKRWLIAGRLGELPRLARERPVVLVANQDFATLGQRWQLNDFTHIRIPPRHSQRRRWALLKEVSGVLGAARARSRRPPLLITQCGGALAYWLHARLFSAHPGGAFYIDMGQALNGWFFDLLQPHDSPWMRIYARSVIENCALEPFYRKLKGTAYDDWFASLP